MRRLAAYNAFDPFTNEPAERWPARLADLAPVDDARVFLTCDGSEAVDSAIKLARIAQVQAGHPERTLIVSRSFAYHGVTYGGLTAQGLPANQAGFGPLLPDFVNLPSDDLEAMAPPVRRAGRPHGRRHHRAGAGRRRRAPARAPATSRGCAGCATSTAPSSSWTR